MLLKLSICIHIDEGWKIYDSKLYSIKREYRLAFVCHISHQYGLYHKFGHSGYFLLLPANLSISDVFQMDAQESGEKEGVTVLYA